MIDRLLFAAALLMRRITLTAYDLRLPVWLVEFVTLALACVAAVVVTLLLHIFISQLVY